MTNRPLGRPPGVETAQLLALIKPLGLKPLDIAELTRSAISRHRDPHVGGHKCSQVSDWLNGKRDMPKRVFELLEAQVWMIEHGYATLEQAKTRPLKELLELKNMTSLDTPKYTNDDPLHNLVEDLRDWFRDDGFIAGVHYDEASMLQQIEEALRTRSNHA